MMKWCLALAAPGVVVADTECPWLAGPHDDSTRANEVLCMDGTYSAALSCDSSGGRAQCPPDTPEMCENPTCGANGDEYCCSTSCFDEGYNQRGCLVTDPNDYYTGGMNEYREYGSTNRTGAHWNNLTAPTQLTGEAYTDSVNGTVGKTGSGVSYDDASHTADTTVLAANPTGGSSCSSRGFKCDFKDAASHMGPYVPLDFVWKIVDPTDYHLPSLNMSTLNCEVDISAADSTSDSDYFYVPLGQAQVGSTDYCDVEAIRRVVNQADTSMTDRIRVRGETARLNNAETTDTDLIGEQFDLICECAQDLSMEASLEVKQESTAMLVRMTSTGQTRTFQIEMKLFSDDELLEEVNFAQGDLFPIEAPSFFFLVRHMIDEDWDAILQIDKCVACDPQVNCNTTVANDYAVTFYDKCDVLVGGPRRRAISNTSWYASMDTEHAYKRDNKWWSFANPNTNPYHAMGLQKFRLQDSNVMRVVCHVSGCVSRPCPPCTAEYFQYRRRLLGKSARRSLQEGEAVEGAASDVSMRISFPGRESTDDDAVGGDTEQQDKDKRTNAFLLLILVLLGTIIAIMVSRLMKQRKHEMDAKSVAPVDVPRH